MKRWQGSCIGAFLVLLIGGASLIFFVPFGGAMIAALPPVFDRLTAYTLWRSNVIQPERRDRSLHGIDLHLCGWFAEGFWQ